MSRNLPILVIACLGLVLATPGRAQLVVERSITSNLTLPDNESTSTYFVWSDSGLSLVSSTAVTLNFSSPFARNPMVMGQIASSLTFGAGGGSAVTGSLFSAGGLSSASQTFTSEAFDGNWLANGRWDLSLTDTQGGGIARLDSWKLAVEGTSSAAGTTMDLGNSGTVRVATGTNSATVNANLATGSAGNTATVEAGEGRTLDVQGVVSGVGNLNKTGSGTVALSGSSANTFSGSATVSAGTLRLEKTGGAVAISGSTIAVNSGGTLLLGAANQINDSTQLTMSGGTVALGGYNETAGRLAVTADSIFDFGTAGGGSNTFSFEDFDTAGYGGVVGLTFSNVGIGSKVVFNTDYTGNTTFNTFTSKVSFSNSSLQGQISFSGGQTTLTVAAIPEPKVYIAAGALALLIGTAEVRRRRQACRDSGKGLRV